MSVSGGATFSTPGAIQITNSYPITVQIGGVDRFGWASVVDNSDAAPITVTPYVTCANGIA
jgi:hypothetical protein